jgi:hypothetical protein
MRTAVRVKTVREARYAGGAAIRQNLYRLHPPLPPGEHQVTATTSLVIITTSVVLISTSVDARRRIAETIVVPVKSEDGRVDGPEALRTAPMEDADAFALLGCRLAARTPPPATDDLGSAPPGRNPTT